MQSGQGDLWEQRVHAGCAAFLDACLDPTVQRISLVDGPAVLGWEEHRRLDEKFGLRIVRDTLQEVMDARMIAPQPLDPLTHLLLAALSEAAMYIAQANDIHAARKEMGKSLERLLDGMRVRE